MEKEFSLSIRVGAFMFKEKSILSIQSHVAYGYVGNKAAVFPLQSLGYDVWPVNTVQFSNHTGYGSFQGDIFSKQHIDSVIKGIIEVSEPSNCIAVLSGYSGTSEICNVIKNTAHKFKNLNKNIIYLCDPVMGDVDRGVFVKQEIVDYFSNFLEADIITPNQYEAELLSNIKIKNLEDAKKVALYFHNRGIKIVVITSLEIDTFDKNKTHVFISNNGVVHIASSPYYHYEISKNGTGDLFSALFLGHYLKDLNEVNALKKTAAHMDIVMNESFVKNTRELRIIDVDYKNNNDLSNVSVMKIS